MSYSRLGLSLCRRTSGVLLLFGCSETNLVECLLCMLLSALIVYSSPYYRRLGINRVRTYIVSISSFPTGRLLSITLASTLDIQRRRWVRNDLMCIYDSARSLDQYQVANPPLQTQGVRSYTLACSRIRIPEEGEEHEICRGGYFCSASFVLVLHARQKTGSQSRVPLPDKQVYKHATVACHRQVFSISRMRVERS